MYRSQSYQHIFKEVSVSDDFLHSFESGQSALTQEEIEELDDLRAELRVNFWRTAELMLTETQYSVVRLTADGYSQTEIAQIRSTHQSTIHKILHGNPAIVGGVIRSHKHGGAIPKLRRILLADPEVVRILDRMREIHDC
jgi:DNA-binding CsgD family transcriptional regulator